MKMLVLISVLAVAQSHDIRIVNKCSFVVWPALRTITGSSYITPKSTRDGLKSGQMVQLQTSEGWYGFIWPRTKCSKGRCESGEFSTKQESLWTKSSLANVSATLAGVHFNENVHGGHQFDKYFISIEDGFNVPLTITPIPGTYKGKCGRIRCDFKIPSVCPNELAVRNENGEIVSCMSACMKFNTDEYCCHGTHGNCKSTGSQHRATAKNYSKLFKQICPEAQAKQHDSTELTCSGMSKQSSGYEIQFCP